MLKKVKNHKSINPKFLIQLLLTGLISASFAATDPGTPIGFASLDGGTTGGKGGEVVKVSTKAQLAAAVAGNDKKIVEVTGNIELDKKKYTSVGSNKTIIGVGDVKIRYGGLELKGVKNVIIKNITFMDPTGQENCVLISDESQNVWIDHCTMTGDPVVSHEKFHDHAIEINTGAKNITISFCHFYNMCQNIMIGHLNTNGAQDKNISVTLHDNWYNGTMQRNPRVRFARVHTFNCMFNDHIWRDHPHEARQGYGIASTCEAKVVVENCHFLNTTFPTHIGFMTSSAGELVAKNCITEKCANEIKTAGTAFDPGSLYKYTVIDPKEVQAHVKKYAGAGKPDYGTGILDRVTHLGNEAGKSLSISIINANQLVIKSTSTDNVAAGTFTIYAVSGKTIAGYDLANQNAGKTVSFNLPEKLGTGNYYYRFVNKNSSFTGLLQYMQQ